MGSESPSKSTSAGSRELNNSTVVLVRARHRGHCLIASERTFGVIVRPQHGQFKYHRRGFRSRLGATVASCKVRAASRTRVGDRSRFVAPGPVPAARVIADRLEGLR